MEDQDQQGGVSLGEILSMIWKRIVWILGISVLAALVIGLVTMFVIGPKKETYNLTFSIEYPYQYIVDEEGKYTGQMQYPDGSVFLAQSIIYADRLNAAKATSADFAKIDIDEMSAEGKITISEQGEGSGVYTVSASASYFTSKTQATAFLKAVCAVTRQNIIDKAKNASVFSDLTIADDATLEKKITILEARYESILSQYEKYLGYGAFTYGEKAYDVRASYAEAFTMNIAAVQIAKLELETEMNEEIIRGQREEYLEWANKVDLNTFEGLNKYHETISKYNELNVQNRKELERLYSIVKYEGDEYYHVSDAFAEKLDADYQTINNASNTYNEIVIALYESNTIVSGSGKVSTTGGANTIMYAAVGFVAAFIIASIVFCVVDYNRKKKSGEPATKSEQPAPETENK